MKTLKKILIGLLILVVLLLVAAAFMPKTFQVVESKEMDVTPSYVYNLVNDHAVAETWNPWVKEDTAMVLTMGETTKGIGGTYMWTSPTMGEGKSTFIEDEKNKKVKAEIYFDGNGPNYYTIDLETKGEKTNVTWTMDSEMGWPFNLMSPFIARSVSKSYKKGLNSLANIATERATNGIYNGIKINETEVPSKFFVMNRAEVKMKNIESFFAKNLGPIFSRVQKEGLEMAGMPSGLVFKWDEAKGVTDMGAAVPITEEVVIKDLQSITLDPSAVLEVIFEGDVANTPIAHAAIDAYMADRDILYNAPVVEEYITDPTQEPDQSKWQTRILYYYDR